LAWFLLSNIVESGFRHRQIKGIPLLSSLKYTQHLVGL